MSGTFLYLSNSLVNPFFCAQELDAVLCVILVGGV